MSFEEWWTTFSIDSVEGDIKLAAEEAWKAAIASENIAKLGDWRFVQDRLEIFYGGFWVPAIENVSSDGKKSYTKVKKVKYCPSCGSLDLVPLSSIDKRICNDCKTYVDWKLAPNQQSVLEDGKRG